MFSGKNTYPQNGAGLASIINLRSLVYLSLPFTKSVICIPLFIMVIHFLQFNKAFLFNLDCYH